MPSSRMMPEEEDAATVGTYMFRGVEYVVTMNVCGASSLVVEVEDKLTADQWRGTFEAAYAGARFYQTTFHEFAVPDIEDLTHKTGNFKQFSIFVSMLESALTQGSESVSLDLLTYSDLESLRNRKAGAGTSNIPPARQNTQNSKRYLILTYTVEFDRIHYPLPLPYVGKPDPRALQETIRQLREEIKSLKRHGTKDFAHKELQKLRKDFEQLLQEKKEQLADFIEYKREVDVTSKGAAAKQVRILKGIINNLEQDLLAERSKRQRSSSKLSEETRHLMDELEEVKASERNLRVRVKSLTNELAIYKRRGQSSVNTTSDSGRRNYSHQRGSSRDNSFTRDSSKLSRGHNSSRSSYGSRRDGSFGRDRSIQSQRSSRSGRSMSNGDVSSNRKRSVSRDSVERGRAVNRSGSSHRERSLSWASRDRSWASRDRSRDKSQDRSWGSSRHGRSPSPSAAGARSPRFDPTAYVKEKSRKKKEADLKQKRTARSRMSGSTERKRCSSPAGSDGGYGRMRSFRASSVGSLNSRTSSLESLSDIGMASDSDSRQQRMQRVFKSNNSSLSNSWDGPPVTSKRHTAKRKPTEKKILASTPERPQVRGRGRDKENHRPHSDVGDSDYFNRSAEISEIDARLNRLQQFMKTNLA